MNYLAEVAVQLVVSSGEHVHPRPGDRIGVELGVGGWGRLCLGPVEHVHREHLPEAVR